MKEGILQLSKGLGAALVVTATAFAMLPSASAAAQTDTSSAPQAPAAVNCNWNPTGSGGGVGMRTIKAIRLRYGPAAGCDFIGLSNMDMDTRLWAVCKYRNPDSGNTWYYVDPADSSWRNGWIYSRNVKVDAGTIENC